MEPSYYNSHVLWWYVVCNDLRSKDGSWKEKVKLDVSSAAREVVDIQILFANSNPNNHPIHYKDLCK